MADEEDVSLQLSHVDEMKQINSIQWNPADQNEVSNELNYFRIVLLNL
jgi:hypothetical protein